MGLIRRSRTWPSALAACALSLVMSVPALAAQPEAEHELAVGSFRRGMQLVEAGQLQSAIDAFREALRHEPTSVGARLDLADCYEKIGSPASAWREYAIAEAHARRGNDPRRAMARTSGAHLQASLLLVTFTRPRANGLELRVDGDPIAEEIVERGSVAVAPGRHQVVLTAPGKKPVALDVSGAAGDTRVLAIAFVDEAPSSPPEEPRDRGSSERRTWAIALGAVGLGGIVLGSVAGAVALSDKSNLERESHDPTVGSTRFYADRSTADTFANASTVAFVAGGVALAAGVGLYLLAPSRPGALRAGIGPIAGGSTGVLVAGSF